MDIQAAQGESRRRGIGRYTMGLAKAIARNAGSHEIWLVLNAHFSESIEGLRSEFTGLVDFNRIRVFETPAPCFEIIPENKTRARIAEKLREAFLASLNPDIVHVFSLFEGYIDNTVSSIKAFESRLLTTVTLYDLIPLTNTKAHLTSPQHISWYFRKINSLRRADHLFAISEYSRSEAISLLQIPESTISVIGGAVDEVYQPILPTETLRQEVWGRHGINRPFLLSIHSGSDPNKNAAGLIQSYNMLPRELQNQYQLVLAGNISETERAKLLALYYFATFQTDNLVIVGRISDNDLIILYNTCSLYICPSFHEGFGLPPLEAMACGAPVIGSNCSAIPEVIGREDALFDPANPTNIKNKIEQVLLDPSFQNSLKEHAQKHAKRFSWGACAQRMLEFWEQVYSQHQRKNLKVLLTNSIGGLPRLALITPMPPEHTGIADYSSELIPYLCRYYDITLIVDQEIVNDLWTQSSVPIENTAWFEKNASLFDRIVYQVGNSPFHKHMFVLLQHFPGIVVLHDFFLSSLQHWMEYTGWKPHAMVQALYNTHGFYALVELQKHGIDYVKLRYPCNGDVLTAATGLIVHSEYVESRIANWADNIGLTIRKVPQLRSTPLISANVRSKARKSLGLLEEDFLVISIGMIYPTKLNHLLLEAWLSSTLVADPRCHLVFVGELPGGDYGDKLAQLAESKNLGQRIIFTGFVDSELYIDYLSAADMAVQLRTDSRGETSRTVLDCLAFAIPLILNAHGTNFELPDGVAIKLSDNFTNEDLRQALERLWKEEDFRFELGRSGQKYIRHYHAPISVAKQYYDAIEHLSLNHWRKSEQRLIDYTIDLGVAGTPANELRLAINAMINNRIKPRLKTLWIDVSVVSENDLRTGIERVTRAVARGLLDRPLPGYRVELVRLDKSGYITANTLTYQLLSIPELQCEHVVIPQCGDIFLGLDLVGDRLLEAQEWFINARRRGLLIFFIVYDLLPISHPEFFPFGSQNWFSDWLRQISLLANGLICISQNTAGELLKWLNENTPNLLSLPEITWCRLGADLEMTTPSTGLSENDPKILEQVSSVPTFLMVGTIEPRKAHAQILTAFEVLWETGKLNINLVIVGKEGWKGVLDQDRVYINNLVNRLHSHPELGQHLFWLENTSDEFLSILYANCQALIAGSWAEGFGLPLVEASRFGIHIIARDIPVFREIGGDNLFYFRADTAEEVALEICKWLKHYQLNDLPPTGRIPVQTWDQCCEEIIFSMLHYQAHRKFNEHA